MQFLALPFALLLFGFLFDHSVSYNKSTSIRNSLVALSIVTIMFSWYQSAGGPLREISRVIINRGRSTVEHFGETPASFRRTGLAVDRVRQLLGLERIVFVTPDIGGLALCCDRIRIVDIALLTNRRLAKDGYIALPSVFNEEMPDIIEAHQVWAALSQIYTIAQFRNKYQPILVDRTRLYLRNDHVKALLGSRNGSWCSIEDANCLSMAIETHRYVEHTNRSDDAAFLVKGRFLLVED
jgi:hypothetical protein